MDIKHKKKQRTIFLTSLILTVLVFSVGVILSYTLDFFRIDEVMGVMESNELDTEAYVLEQDLVDIFGGDKCSIMHQRIVELKKELTKAGVDLTNYGKLSFFRQKEFDYIKRRYYLIELNFYALVRELNEKCGRRFIPILFFYETDNTKSERQGFILDELSDFYKREVVVLSFDKDYDKEPLVQLLVDRFNVSTSPTMIIDDSMKIERLAYLGELNATITKLKRKADLYGKDFSFDFVLKATGTDKQPYLTELSKLMHTTQSDFAKADISLMLGRLSNNDTLICSSLEYYDNINTTNKEEKALIFETYAAIGCGRNKKAFLLEAAKLWDEMGLKERANIERDIATGKALKLKSSIEEISPAKFKVNEKASLIIIGESFIEATEDDVIITQVDRVNRDWLSFQLNTSPFDSNQLLTTFSERLSYDESELRSDIGWHEGARIKELKTIGLTNIPAVGTMVVKIDNKWYAPNENGIFMFEVPIDKLQYPTTRFLRENVAIIMDTHGINMLVEQAIRNKATVVIGCCDHPGKAKAVQYLSEKGIKSICFTDKYIPLLLGRNVNVLPSPPIIRLGDSFVIGNRPIKINLNQTIVAMDVKDITKVQSYYDTPARYFKILKDSVDINLVLVNIDGMGQMTKVIDAALKNNANIIGARVFDSNDYKTLRKWLDLSNDNKVVLFHSASYPYGYLLLQQYPDQTTFGDVNVMFE